MQCYYEKQKKRVNCLLTIPECTRETQLFSCMHIFSFSEITKQLLTDTYFLLIDMCILVTWPHIRTPEVSVYNRQIKLFITIWCGHIVCFQEPCNVSKIAYRVRHCTCQTRHLSFEVYTPFLIPRHNRCHHEYTYKTICARYR